MQLWKAKSTRYTWRADVVGVFIEMCRAPSVVMVGAEPIDPNGTSTATSVMSTPPPVPSNVVMSPLAGAARVWDGLQPTEQSAPGGKQRAVEEPLAGQATGN